VVIAAICNKRYGKGKYMKTIKSMISVILLLGMGGNALAIESNWTNGGGDGLWCKPSKKWASEGVYPLKSVSR